MRGFGDICNSVKNKNKGEKLILYLLIQRKKENDNSTTLTSSKIMTLTGLELNVIMAGNYLWRWKDGLIPFGKIFSVVVPS